MNKKCKENKAIDYKLLLLLSDQEIKKRINEIAIELSKKFSDEAPIMIGILNGSFIFLADLLRFTTVDCEIDFVKVRSYAGKKPSGTIQLLKDISSDIKDRDVIIVEDIIDTGLTIKFLRERILGASPQSVAIATLLHKPGIAKFDFPIDFIGFEIPHKYVVGYGLDYNQKMRHLDGIYYIPDDLND